MGIRITLVVWAFLFWLTIHITELDLGKLLIAFVAWLLGLVTYHIARRAVIKRRVKKLRTMLRRTS